MNHSIPAFRLHHVAVQTSDLANSVAWYRDFLGCTENWSIDHFSELTTARLPGITRITEMAAGPARFHLVERGGGSRPDAADNRVQFQHVCLEAGSPAELRAWRNRWQELFGSGRYTFVRPEPATDVVVDDDGIESFYCLDVNGLEFEFTFVPDGVS